MNGQPFDFDGSNNNNHHPSGLRALKGDDDDLRTPPSLSSENGDTDDDDDFLALDVANDDDAKSAPEELGVEVLPETLQALLTLEICKNQKLTGRLLTAEKERDGLRAQLELVVEQKDTVQLGWKLEEEENLQNQTELEKLKAAVLNRIVTNEDDTVETLREKLRDAYGLLQSETDHLLFEKLKLTEQVYVLKDEKDDLTTKLEAQSKKLNKSQRTELQLRHEIAMLKVKIQQLRSGKSE